MLPSSFSSRHAGPRPALWLLALTLLAIGGCSITPKQQEPTVTPAESEKKGDAEIAKQYERAARDVSDPQRSRYLFKAARAALRAGDGAFSYALLEQINTQSLSKDKRSQVAQLRLRAQAKRLPTQKALEALAPPDASTKPEIAATIWKLRAQVMLRAGRLAQGIHALTQRRMWLLDPKAIQQNQSHIWQALQSANPAQYQPEAGREFGNITLGWLALAQIDNRNWPTEKKQNKALSDWVHKYPRHPATYYILKEKFGYQPSIPKAARLNNFKTGTIGVALPLSGDLANAANALLDGFLAAYYQQPEPRPALRIYDTNALPNDTSIAERAAKDGIGILVGPLTKDAVRKLTNQPPPFIRILALNYIDTKGVSPGFYQFGLSPEDEARAAARRAVAMGYLHGLALVPKGEWGTRVVRAFQATLQKMGGKLVEFVYYDPARNDNAVAIKELLNYHGKREKRSKKEPLLKRADFIFMAAQPTQARLLRTQLRFYQATEIPVFATSHVYNSASNGQRHNDLHKVMFTDMPWVLGTHHVERRKRHLSEQWPTASGNLARLFAMGLDSWALVQRMRNQALHVGTLFQGTTGGLYMQPDGQIRRRLDWAQLKHGQPVILPPRKTIALPVDRDIRDKTLESDKPETIDGSGQQL